ncbi:MAG: histidine kinase dimerization/phosphoacceptor domain-containing protein, partial [Thermoleophilia bacterium]|nr:histidine kinase dimerization/phosphoacceptor domain-containing protein [Thermoleophilia bacterium]
MRWPLVASWACAALAAAALVAALTLRATDPDPTEGGFAVLVTVAIAAPAVAAGVVIARGRPRNPVGAIVAFLGLLPVLDLLWICWAGAAVRGDVPGASWAVLAYQGDWIPVFGALALLLLLFPDGRTPGPRWRPVVTLAVVATLAAAAVSSLRDTPFDSPYAGVERPMPVLSSAASSVLMSAALIALTAALALAAAAMIVRFRRSRGVERIQIKWLAAAAVLLPVAIVAGTADGLLSDEPGLLTVIPFAVVYLGLLSAVIVAMLRHGLYDVDRVISRTITWMALTLVLAGAAVLVALVVADLLGGGTTAGAAVAAVAATLAFDPLRRRLQRVVDRRFDRDRSRAVDRVEAFAARLHDGEAAPEGIEAVLRDALGDPALRLYVWLPGAGVHADLGGNPADPGTPPEGRVVTQIGRGAAPLGAVVHSAGLLARPGLLTDVLRAAALPVEIARLRGELRGRLEEVEESRVRIVRAGYEERRRHERDQHDGAQQRLVALGMALRRVQRRLDGTLATTEDAQSDEDRIKRAIAASLTSVSAKSLSFADMGEFGDDAESDEEEDEEGGGVVGAPPRPSFTTKCGRCSRPRRL